MAPLDPKRPSERAGAQIQQTWPNFKEFTDPMEPADHLDKRTQSRISHFPSMHRFLRSRFGMSRESDHEWFPVRPLGKGGFGGVALWERRDAAGNVIEETAVKQSSWKSTVALKKWPEVAREAAVMSQLNEKKNENILRLKFFKLFTQNDTKPSNSTWYLISF
jgi:hypothetical protein